jgi:hypothetical protein
LDFLGRCLFLVKTFDSGGWICLDFLGFSRPNPDFSVGYADKTTQSFSRRPGSLKGDSATETLRNAVDCSWRKRNSLSDFLQEIAPERASLFF